MNDPEAQHFDQNGSEEQPIPEQVEQVADIGHVAVSDNELEQAQREALGFMQAKMHVAVWHGRVSGLARL